MIIAFIQFLAIIALIVWALLYGTVMLLYGALALLGVMILLNMIF